MQQQTLPLWTHSGVTYTEAQAFCVQQYALRGASLIAETMQHLEALKDREADHFKVLHELNELSIELSTFSQEWNAFSLAVFETIIFPRSLSWTIRHLRIAFNATVRRLEKKNEQQSGPR